MDTFQALDAYIQSQKALLVRTQSDVDRLRRIREQAAANPEQFFDSFDEKLNDNLFRLDHQPDIAAEVQDKIDWDLFKSQDPTPLRTFAASLRAAQHARSQPSPKQQSPLSSAQQLVRAARRTIIEPVLASFELSSDSSDEEQQPAPDDRRRRIHLRKGGLTLRASGVHILRKMDDESGDVDIATEGEPLAPTPNGVITSPPSPHPTELPATSNPNTRSPRLSRPRRPLPTRAHAAKAKTRTLKTKQQQQLPEPDRALSEPQITKKEKPKSETYKQAWSISEQHLLERLLTEIPDGEKNRWAKISKAMGGRRTPRQVASRVQKYFEKLKLYGVNVGEVS